MVAANRRLSGPRRWVRGLARTASQPQQVKRRWVKPRWVKLRWAVGSVRFNMSSGGDQTGGAASRAGRISSGDGPVPGEYERLVTRLAGAGFVAAEEEAAELWAGDIELLEARVGRRLTGEPLAWITGTVVFCGWPIHVDPGVYVPRPQSESLARRAARLLPSTGLAIDLCTGAGAIARTLAVARPGARVVATDLDERAVACAITNGVEAYCGDLFAPLPVAPQAQPAGRAHKGDVIGRADVVVAVVPYVPTPDLPFLQRDTLAWESARSYDGGRDGTEILRRVMTEAPRYLRRGGALLLELGGEQADTLSPDLARLGYDNLEVVVDDDGDVRGLVATLGQ